MVPFFLVLLLRFYFTFWILNGEVFSARGNQSPKKSTYEWLEETERRKYGEGEGFATPRMVGPGQNLIFFLGDVDSQKH
jgi:hypothetical protein